MTLQQLPALNATLNGIATALLVTGWVLIRKRRIIAHRNCMLSAFGVSTLFLISYLIYHFVVQTTTPFRGPEAWKPVYLIMLASHIILAMAVPPLAGLTLYFAFRDQRDRHRRIARITLPIWLYVSVTGVVVYLMLYHWYPSEVWLQFLENAART